MSAALPAIVKPSRARRRHDRIERVDGRELLDSAGHVAAPFRVVGTLMLMQRAGTITPAQHAAGERFHALFRLAALDALKAAAIDRVPAIGAVNATSGANGNERARREIARVIRALGGEASVTASCAWHVLGLDWSLRQWSAKALRGNKDQACGVVIATLAILETHFGA